MIHKLMFNGEYIYESKELAIKDIEDVAIECKKEYA